MRDTLLLAGFTVLCLGAGWLGSLATAPAVDSWYARLVKPPWNPPSWLFAPVWTALYLCMAVAAWLVCRRAGLGSAPMKLFAVQLALNAGWPWLFFGLRRPDLAFAGILLLLAAIIATLTAFRPWSPAAGILLAPYLAWVGFASVLNLAIWRLNSRTGPGP